MDEERANRRRPSIVRPNGVESGAGSPAFFATGLVQIVFHFMRTCKSWELQGLPVVLRANWVE